MKKLLRTWLWMLALSLALGLAIGTCVRRQAEEPARYIGQAEEPARYIGELRWSPSSSSGHSSG